MGKEQFRLALKTSILKKVIEVAMGKRWKKCPVLLSGNPAALTDATGSAEPALSVAT